MDSPSPPQSLQNAEKAVDPVNNEKNGSVNIMSSDAVVVTIDLEKYEQKKECLLVEIKSLCQQLWSNAALNNQIKVFKRIEIQYSSDIDEEALWTYIFRQYIRVIRKCSNVSIIIIVFILRIRLTLQKFSFLVKRRYSLSDACRFHASQIHEFSVQQIDNLWTSQGPKQSVRGS